MSCTYSWVEETSADPEEDPRSDGKGKAKAESNIEQSCGITPLLYYLGLDYLGTAESEEEEDEGAEKLAQHHDEMSSDRLWHKLEHRRGPVISHSLVCIKGTWFALHAWQDQRHPLDRFINGIHDDSDGNDKTEMSED